MCTCRPAVSSRSTTRSSSWIQFTGLLQPRHQFIFQGLRRSWRHSPLSAKVHHNVSDSHEVIQVVVTSLKGLLNDDLLLLFLFITAVLCAHVHEDLGKVLHRELGPVFTHENVEELADILMELQLDCGVDALVAQSLNGGSGGLVRAHDGKVSFIEILLVSQWTLGECQKKEAANLSARLLRLRL